MGTSVATDELDCYGFPKRICAMCGYATLRGGAGLYTLLILRSLRQLRAATLF